MLYGPKGLYGPHCLTPAPLSLWLPMVKYHVHAIVDQPYHADTLIAQIADFPENSSLLGDNKLIKSNG